MDRREQQPSGEYLASRMIRLTTLTRLRWLAVTGQTIAVIVVAFGLNFSMPYLACFGLILCSGFLNIFLSLNFPANQRIQPWPAFQILSFDVLQLAALLYLTGGIQNPFAVLIIVPVVISSSAQPIKFTLALAALTTVLVCVLAVFHYPLPWFDGVVFSQPGLLLGGLVFAILSTMSFAAIYAWRVSREAQELSDALAATELVLQREQHLSTLDGLAAAAAHELGTPLATIHVVLKEMEHGLDNGKWDIANIQEDVTLLRSQSARCREILGRLRSLSEEGSDHIGTMSFKSLIEEAAAPYRGPDIHIEMIAGVCEGPEPMGERQPGVIYGIGNIVENASDFARHNVKIRWWWNEQALGLVISDDGPGYSLNVLDHIGEPYVSDRIAQQMDNREPQAGGLGLGLFIARTLLGRSGAKVEFSNSAQIGEGAVARIRWQRSEFETAPPST